MRVKHLKELSSLVPISAVLSLLTLFETEIGVVTTWITTATKEHLIESQNTINRRKIC